MTIFRKTHAGTRTCYAFDEHIPKDFCNEVKTTLFQVGDSLLRLSGSGIQGYCERQMLYPFRSK